jgi:hypothetical protein
MLIGVAGFFKGLKIHIPIEKLPIFPHIFATHFPKYFFNQKAYEKNNIPFYCPKFIFYFDKCPGAQANDLCGNSSGDQKAEFPRLRALRRSTSRR